MWKIVFQSLTYISPIMSDTKSLHMIESQLYFLFCKVCVYSSYHMPTELLDFAYYLQELFLY